MLTALSQNFGGGEDAMGGAADEMTNAMVRYMPLHALKSLSGGAFTDEAMQKVVSALNAMQE